MKFKLKQITSAVSVGCMALVLTACGNDTVSPTSSALVSSTKLNDVSAKLEQLQKQADQLAADKKAAEAKLKEEIDALQKALEEKKENLNAGTGTGTGTGTTPAPAPEGKNDLVTEEIVKHNPLIGSFDAEKQQSFGAGNYSNRGDKSNYDRSPHLNPVNDHRGSNSAPMTADINKQNPHLTNFVVGSESIKNANGTSEMRAINYVGEYANQNGTPEALDITATQFQTSPIGSSQSTQTYTVRETIQDANEENNTILASSQINALSKNPALHYGSEDTGLVVAEKSVSVLNKLSDTKYPNPLAQGEDLNTKSTNVFGKNYNGINTDSKGNQLFDNSYAVSANKTILPVKLHNVQYGRLTANIDVLASKPEDSVLLGNLNTPDSIKLASTDPALVNRKLADRTINDPESIKESTTVDTYFHRGTNATTLDQMKAVKARNIDLQYQGHAITYGVNHMPVAEGTTDNTIPSAFGKGDTIRTVGNFVQATYKTGTDKVNGNVYNLLDKSLADNNNPLEQQNLVSFTGDVKGNSILGTAKNLTEVDSEGKHLEGTFFGTFYGKQAEELGGTITSIERDEKNFYGEGEWGAVFGAAQGNQADNAFGYDLNTNTTTTGKK